MIVELAEYERSPESVVSTAQQLHDNLFGDRPLAEALIAELDGRVAAQAIFYTTFSTWEGTGGIWLEDLYVRPAFRRTGVGEALFRHLAAVTLERGYTRYEWVALDWNTPALSFYAKHGAKTHGDWLLHRLSEDELARAARA